MLFLSLVVISCVALSGAQVVAPETAVDITTKAGLHVIFPFYENIKTLDPELANVTTKHTVLTIRYLQEVLGQSLKGKKIGAFGWVGITTKLIGMGRAAKNARKNVTKYVGSNGQFNSAMADMFKRMMARSNADTLATTENHLELKEELDAVFDALVQALEVSPVSQYFDWPNGTINGLNFEVYASRLMARLSKNGFSGIFTCIDTLLTWIARLSSIG